MNGKYNKMKIVIAGKEFKNPLITASGTYGFGHEYGEFINLNNLGGICVKALTLREKKGNPPPRIAETPSGILNSVGLQNPGVEYFVKNELPKLKKYDTNIIVNIAGTTIEEYCELAKIISNTDIDMIELNISCPNIKEGGVTFGTDPEMVKQITTKVKENCKKPLIVKLTPNVNDIVEISKAAESAGADAISLINTILGMKIDIYSRRPVLANNVGGLSGPAVRPVAVRMVWEAANSVNIPIIGMGGITSGEDAIEFILAGATGIAVGTANFIDPYISQKIIQEMENYLDEYGIDNINDIIGRVECY